MPVHAFTRLWMPRWAKLNELGYEPWLPPPMAVSFLSRRFGVCSCQGLGYAREQGLAGRAFSRLLTLYK